MPGEPLAEADDPDTESCGLSSSVIMIFLFAVFVHADMCAADGGQ